MARNGETIEQTIWRKRREEIARVFGACITALAVGLTSYNAMPIYHAPTENVATQETLKKVDNKSIK